MRWKKIKAEAEKEEKKAERERKKAAAEAKKKQEKADKEAAKQLAALNKSVKGGPKAAVLRAMVPVMKPGVKPVAKLVAAVAKPVWEAPEENDVKPWVVKGVTYLRMANDFLFAALPNDALGPPVGLYDPKTDTIDTEQKLVFVDDD